MTKHIKIIKIKNVRELKKLPSSLKTKCVERPLLVRNYVNSEERIIMDRTNLKRLIAESGLKISFIVQKINMDRSSFWQKLNNNKPFKEDEVKKLCELLNIPSDKANLYFCTKLC